MYYRDENGEWQEIILEPSGDTLPIGFIGAYGGETAPTGWLICDGTAYNKTDYPELYNAIGTAFNEENDGETVFRVPDLRDGKVPVGMGGDGPYSIGATGGEEEHTLTVSELPSNVIQTTTTGSNADGYIMRGGYTSTGTYNIGGSGNAHNNMPPYVATNYIIKAKQSIGVVGTVSEDITDTNNNAVPNCETVKNYVDNKHIEIATAYLSSNIDNAGQQYLQMTQINSNSDRLTLSNGGILIGAGISKIKISGNVFGVSNNNSGYLWCYIRKNRGSTTTNVSIAIDNTNTLFGSVSFSPKLIDVQEGDLIILYKEDGSTTSIRSAGNTWLTVEVVE